MPFYVILSLPELLATVFTFHVELFFFVVSILHDIYLTVIVITYFTIHIKNYTHTTHMISLKMIMNSYVLNCPTVYNIIKMLLNCSLKHFNTFKTKYRNL